MISATSSLDAGAAAPLTADDLVALLERTFSLAVFALLLLIVGLLHVCLPMRAPRETQFGLGKMRPKTDVQVA